MKNRGYDVKLRRTEMKCSIRKSICNGQNIKFLSGLFSLRIHLIAYDQVLLESSLRWVCFVIRTRSI